MKRINTSLFLFALITSSPSILAQDNLYQQVFGKRQKTKTVTLPIIWQYQQIGEWKVKLKGDKLISLNRSDVIKTLKPIVEETIIKNMNGAKAKLRPVELKKLRIRLKYDYQNLRILLNIPSELQKASQLSFSQIRRPWWYYQADRPNKFSGIINYRLSSDISHKHSSSSNYRADFEHYFNFNSYVLEGRVNFDHNEKHQWLRQETRIVKDFQKKMLRLSLGDVDYPTIGFQNSRELGGLTLKRDFSLDPYFVSSPTSNKEFTLNEKSFVRIFVNSRVVRSEFFDAGKHLISDLPLNNGINDIIVEITDSNGQKRLLKFRDNSSTEHLAKGQSLFSFSAGKESEIVDHSRQYNIGNGVTYSGYYQYGYSNDLTLAFGVQGDSLQYNIDIPFLISTSLGNFSFETSYSKVEDNDLTGQAYRLRYDLYTYKDSFFGRKRFSWSMTKKTRRFATLGSTSPNNGTPYTSSFSLGGMIGEQSSITLGATYSLNDNEGEQNPYGGDLTLNQTWGRRLTTNISLGRSRDEFGKWNDVLFFFLNINFPEHQKFVNSYYDRESNTKRFNVISQSPDNIDALNSQLSYEETNESRAGEIDLEYKHSLFKADLKYAHKSAKSGTESSLTNIDFASAFVFTADQFAVSRPVTGSFAILKASQDLEDQNLLLKTYSDRPEGSSSWLAPAMVSDLRPYQYYNIGLDTENIIPGITLKSNEFKIRPEYRTGHTLLADLKGVILLRAVLKDNNAPLALRTGYLLSADGKERFDFFTNRRGRFILEGIYPGKYFIRIDGLKGEIEVKIPKKTKGILNLGIMKWGQNG